MRVIVVAGGSVSQTFLQKQIKNNELVIAADGGVFSLLDAGIVPRVAIGDFDTTGTRFIDSWQAMGIEVIQLPVEKDVTDTHAALEYALRYEPKEIYLYGVFGGSRMDHTLVNISLLEWLDTHHVKGYIQDETNRLQLIHGPEQIDLYQHDFQYISLLPLSDQLTGVTTNGLAYPLHAAVLKRGDSLGISNYMTGKKASISIRQGFGLVIESRDA
jgi:thiamine pyrophosphokinase